VSERVSVSLNAGVWEWSLGKQTLCIPTESGRIAWPTSM